MRQKRKAQGLLETTVAFSILITGITTLMALVVAASIGRIANEKQTVAVNLAREGIEVAVRARNRNWIANQPFDTGLKNGTDYTYTAVFAPATNSWTLNSAISAIGNADAKVFRYLPSGAYPDLMYQASGGTPAANSEDTGFRRMLSFDAICFDGATETVVVSGSACVGSPGKIGIRATALVQWTEKSGTHSISVVESLYDWR